MNMMQIIEEDTNKFISRRNDVITAAVIIFASCHVLQHSHLMS